MTEYKHFKENISKENVRHVLGISGGKDSAALAIYLKDNYPDEVVKKVEANEKKNKLNQKKVKSDWKEVLLKEEDEAPEDQACLICSL